MGKWLELFRTLKNLDQSALTDSDTSRHTAPSVNDRPHPHDRPPHLDVLTHEPVCHDVSLSVRPDGFRFSAIRSSIEVPDAAAYDAALTVFCDFETRNVGGCDLAKVGVWRYAIDPATEILCFGYRVGAHE